VTAARAAPPGTVGLLRAASTSGISIFFEIALDDDGHRDGERGTVARVRGARPGQRPKQPQSPLLVKPGKNSAS